jgi:hypothetical protein
MKKFKLTYSRTDKDKKEFNYKKATMLANSEQDARFTLVNMVNRYTENKRLVILKCEEL